MTESIAVNPDVARLFAKTVYCQLGVSEPHADLIADSLCQADVWGHQSHGIMRTFWYAKRMQTQATRITENPSLVTDAGAIAVMDGKNGIGQVVAQNAMQEAIARAKLHGVGVVTVRSSGHFGTAMYFTQQAALAGCIGFLFTNASPAMAPWGGKTKLVGTNPWSIAAPAGTHPPMMLDIANTAVARGKLYVAKQQRQKIPFGWAIDEDGQPTDNPIMGIAGNILPFAGHKGFAIATVVDMLSGVLSGSRYLNEVKGPYEPQGESGVGHLVIALNISAFRPLSAFNDDMNIMIEKIKTSPKKVGSEEIYYPGELEAINEKRHRNTGILIPTETVHELNNGARELGVPVLTETDGVR